MSSFAPKKSRRASCYSCNRYQKVDTLFEKVDHWEDEQSFVRGTNEYYVFQCGGCDAIFFCSSSASSEDRDDYYNEAGEHVTEYPWTTNYMPEMAKSDFPRLSNFSVMIVDSNTAKLLNEVYKAIDNSMFVLAAMGARTTFDCASEFLGIAPENNFAEKLELLRKQSFISGRDKASLEVLIDAGGAAAHRGWEPDRSTMIKLVEILNDFISKNLLKSGDAKKIRAQIPAKKTNIEK